ncbi:MAG: hypothetical protein NTX64_19100, partial [Elusimicrobia bacterium]|nr:hypothetical protein [Elusimicrobiota bacterium]
LRRIVQRGWEVILGHLLAGRREGIFHFTRPPEEVARLLQDNIIGAMLFAIAHPDIVKPKDFKEKWEEAVALHAGWKR